MKFDHENILKILRITEEKDNIFIFEEFCKLFK